MIKTIVAAALPKAIEAGDVDSEDQKVIDFLPWLTGRLCQRRQHGRFGEYVLWSQVERRL